jgi:hypothetical protein
MYQGVLVPLGWTALAVFGFAAMLIAFLHRRDKYIS